MGLRIVRMIIRVAGWVATLLLLGLVALAVIVPRATGGAALTVLSGSMTPTIPVGSLVVVVPVATGDLRPGDVITYQRAPGVPEFVTHRVVKVNSDTEPITFVTKGDANEKRDVDPVPAGAVRGEVRAHIPYAGFASQLLSGRGGLILFAGILTMVLVLPYLARQLLSRRAAATGKATEAEVDEPADNESSFGSLTRIA